MVRKFVIGDKVRCFSGFEPHGKLRFDPDSPIYTVTDIKVVRATKSLKYQLDGDKYWSGNFLEKVEDTETSCCRGEHCSPDKAKT